MRLHEGQRVKTKVGQGRIVALHNAVDTVPPHGKPTRGIAYAVVLLDKGGRRMFPARELEGL